MTKQLIAPVRQRAVRREQPKPIIHWELLEAMLGTVEHRWRPEDRRAELEKLLARFKVYRVKEDPRLYLPVEMLPEQRAAWSVRGCADVTLDGLWQIVDLLPQLRLLNHCGILIWDSADGEDRQGSLNDRLMNLTADVALMLNIHRGSIKAHLSVEGVRASDWQGHAAKLSEADGDLSELRQQLWSRASLEGARAARAYATSAEWTVADAAGIGIGSMASKNALSAGQQIAVDIDKHEVTVRGRRKPLSVGPGEAEFVQALLDTKDEWQSSKRIAKHIGRSANTVPKLYKSLIASHPILKRYIRSRGGRGNGYSVGTC